jgi:hypothetical protein
VEAPKGAKIRNGLDPIVSRPVGGGKLVHFTVERIIRAKPEEFYTWYADYTSQDYSGPNWSPAEGLHRAVKEQDEDHVVFTDRYGRIELECRGRKHRPTGVDVEGVGRSMSGRVTSRIGPAPEGTKLSIEFEFLPHGALKLVLPLMTGRIERDTNHHVDAHILDFYASQGRPPGVAAR